MTDLTTLQKLRDAMKWFKVKLDIGIAGRVQAHHFVAADGLLRFYASESNGQPVAVYALASVASVEELPAPRRMGDGQSPYSAPSSLRKDR